MSSTAKAPTESRVPPCTVLPSGAVSRKLAWKDQSCVPSEARSANSSPSSAEADVVCDAHRCREGRWDELRLKDVVGVELPEHIPGEQVELVDAGSRARVEPGTGLAGVESYDLVREQVGDACIHAVSSTARPQWIPPSFPPTPIFVDQLSAPVAGSSEKTEPPLSPAMTT